MQLLVKPGNFTYSTAYEYITSKLNLHNYLYRKKNYLMDQGKKNLEEETKDAFKDPRIDNEDSQIGL